jgi:predicted dehydrogenase
MVQPLRWGILGTGNIARQFSVGVRASRRGRLVGVGSRAEGTARDFAAAHEIPQAHGTYEELLHNREIDAIYNSLPNSLHHEWTIRALNAGKHVLCEKPFAVSEAQSQEMFDVARRRGLALVEAFMYRSHPLTLAVLEAVRGGAIGQVRLIRTSFCYNTKKIEGNVRFDRGLAGGALMDIGCYCISFSRLVAGSEPARITAAAKMHASGVDEITVGTLGFADDTLATFSCGMSLHADNTASICGSEGYIDIPIPWKPPAEAAEFIVARSTPPRMDSPGAKAPAAAPGRETRRVSANTDLYGVEADAFAATVQDGAAPAVSEQDTLGNMRVLDAIRGQIGLSFQGA